MAHLILEFRLSGFTIVLMTLLLGYTSGEYDHLFNNGNDLCVGTNCPDRSGNGVSGAMWFGPRLGRRRRSGGASTDNEIEMDTVVDIVNSGAWRLVPVHGVNEKRHSTQFTPRLGRELDEEFMQRVIAINNDHHLNHQLDTKSSDVDPHHQLMPFTSPLLFQPRLGRQQIYIPSSRNDYRLPESLRNF